MHEVCVSGIVLSSAIRRLVKCLCGMWSKCDDLFEKRGPEMTFFQFNHFVIYIEKNEIIIS